MSQEVQRQARYGHNLYKVTIPDPEQPTIPDVLYLCADSITVREGTLMLAAEVSESDERDGLIELPPIAIFAPGQWLSVLFVSWEKHEVLFSEETWQKIEDEVGDE